VLASFNLGNPALAAGMVADPPGVVVALARVAAALRESAQDPDLAALSGP
jgi:hypothetical protein